MKFKVRTVLNFPHMVYLEQWWNWAMKILLILTGRVDNIDTVGICDKWWHWAC